MNRLKDKVALVVGAGQAPGTTIGNGRAVAKRFAAEGAAVVAVDVDLARAQATAAAIQQAGGRCLAVAADILQERDIERMVGTCVQEFGRIDVLHNNVGAAASAGDAPIAQITADTFDFVQALNLRAMAMTCKHVLPLMQARQCGVILNVGSVAALSAYKNIAYKTSKAGVIALTQNIALQYAEYGIRANCILPGLIDTPMAIEARSGANETMREKIRMERSAKVPLRRRMGTAWDVAHAALFLASDEADFITGACLPVDGGALARIG